MTMKLTPPEKPKEASQMEQLADLISPDLEYMKPWASESAMLYLAVTLYYILRKTVVGTGNMKNTATMHAAVTASMVENMREDQRSQPSSEDATTTTKFTKFVYIQLFNF